MSSNFVTQEVLLCLQSSSLFKGMDENDLRFILSNCRRECWPKRSQVMPIDKAERRFYVLLNGRIKIEAQNAENGRAITLYILRPGDGYNLSALLKGRAHEVQAETLDPVEIASAPLEHWQGWLDIYPALRQAAAHCAAERLQEVSELAQDLALHDTSTRLARLLLRHVDSTDDVGNPFQDMVHEDIASLIGTVRVVVSRLINQFKRESIIAIEERRIQVVDLDRLKVKAETNTIMRSLSHHLLGNPSKEEDQNGS